MFTIKKLILIVGVLIALIVLALNIVNYYLSQGNTDMYNELVRSGKVKDGKYVGDQKILYSNDEYGFEYSYPAYCDTWESSEEQEGLKSAFAMEAKDHSEALLIWCNKDPYNRVVSLDTITKNLPGRQEKVRINVGKEIEALKCVKEKNQDGRALVHVVYFFVNGDGCFLFDYICLKERYEKYPAIGEKMLSRLKLRDSL